MAEMAEMGYAQPCGLFILPLLARLPTPLRGGVLARGAGC